MIMKKTIATILLFFFCTTLFAQEEVTFNFYRKPTNSIKSKLKLSVNGKKVAKLKNGESATCKMKLDISKPVTILSQIGMTKKKIKIMISPDRKCNIETFWNEIDPVDILFEAPKLNLVLVSGGNVIGEPGVIVEPLVNQKNISATNRVENSDTIRQAWIEKGGKLRSIYIDLGATFFKVEDITGVGIKVEMGSSYLNLKIPEYKLSTQTWSSLVYGYSFGFQYYTVKIPEMKPVLFVDYMWSFNGGYTIGVGKYKNKTTWKGSAFELTYRPSIVLSIPYTSQLGFESSYAINMMGFGFAINFNNFSTNAARIAPKPQSKLSFFMLPPVKGLPLFINVSYGTTFYRKRK
jgi:hypothetical protein